MHTQPKSVAHFICESVASETLCPRARCQVHQKVITFVKLIRFTRPFDAIAVIALGVAPSVLDEDLLLLINNRSVQLLCEFDGAFALFAAVEVVTTCGFASRQQFAYILVLDVNPG